MPKRRFVINGKYNGYAIRNHVFVKQPNGGLVYETDDPEVIRLIEGADGYGGFINPAETVEELAAMKDAEEGPVLRIRAEGEFLDSEGPTLRGTAEDVTEEDAPIAHQGARGTSAGKRQRKGDITESSK